MKGTKTSFLLSCGEINAAVRRLREVVPQSVRISDTVQLLLRPKFHPLCSPTATVQQSREEAI